MPRRHLDHRLRSPRVAAAMMSPSAIVAFGIGTAAAVLIGVPVIAAAAIGAVAWSGRVALSVPRRSTRIGRPDDLGEPWRGYVEGAQAAKDRFDSVVADMDDGPLRDRLTGLALRLNDGIAASWRVARRGNDISAAIARLDTDRTRAELSALRASRAGRPPSDAAARTERALEAQVAAADRLYRVRDDARDRLRLLDARFDELVARAVEVSIGVADGNLLGDDVDGLVTELEALRSALEEADGADRQVAPRERGLPPPTTGPA